jgi:ATP-binding cassette subfamily F protein 3
MLQVFQLTKSFGDHQVLAGISLIINRGEHVGLIGGNGAGKTTLLRCIVGELQPDSGSISLQPGTTIGYLQQAFAETPGQSVADVLDAAQADLVARPSGWPRMRPSQRWPPTPPRWLRGRRSAATSASTAPRP